MTRVSPFTIYNADAGSGKTFTLVKEYLKIVLTSNKEDYYKHILGITFTNKAVAEMKQRIIDELVQFSMEHSLQKNPTMLKKIAEETNMTPLELHLKSRKVLDHLLHHYANFSIETIDHFNHRLIRTFAKDLKLTGNFEVTLDTDLINELAVEQLLSKAGDNESITKILVDFALEKADDDKSWNIFNDIAKTSKILFNENDVKHVAELKQYSLGDFMKFRKSLWDKKKKAEAQIQHKASELLSLIESEGIPFDVFQYNMLYKHLLKLSDGIFVQNEKLQSRLEEGGFALYKKNTPEAIISRIDAFAPYLLEEFLNIKKAVSELMLVNQFIKSITPISVINLVNHEIELLKEEQNMLPISEFNTLIHAEIKDQPAPFIYERLGEKYRHFFIDEFQDTSQLQWDNLIPLIDNALSQQYEGSVQGSLMLVGDAKQSIYRWRGGLPEQFISLYKGSSPFMENPEVLSLDTNFRSHDQVIEFNNSFFEFIARQFSDQIHSKLYRLGSSQLSNKKEGGYVSLQFIDASKKADAVESYSRLILETIESLKTKGFEEGEICILTRKKKEGIAVGQHLLNNGIPIVSSETLLLDQSDIVNCLINALILSISPDNEIVKLDLLYFLHEHFDLKEDKHEFFKLFVGGTPDEFTNLLQEHGVDFSLKKMNSLSVYEGCEYCIRQFKLNAEPNAYLLGFMDHVYEFECHSQNDAASFLNDWEINKDRLSIPMADSHNAVKIMTIHKAKGLEFRVVLFPFADVDIYYEKDASVWFPVNFREIDLKRSRINFNQEIRTFGDEGEQIYENRRTILELDNINLLYVTMTRAVEQLYVFSGKPGNSSSERLKNYSDFFRAYLSELGVWDDARSIYEFGESKKTELKPEKKPEIRTDTLNYLSQSPNGHGMKIFNSEALLWDTDAEKRIDFGNHIHHIMERVITAEDIPSIKKEYQSQEILSGESLAEIFGVIDALVSHPDLSPCFSPGLNVLNERDIITKEGEILRPDRVVFHNKSNLTIIDYKTGAQSEAHVQQINRYAEALQEMGYLVGEKLLVYCSHEKIEINKA